MGIILGETDSCSSPVALFVLSLVCLQTAAALDPVHSLDRPVPQIYTLRSDVLIEARAKTTDYVAHPAGELVCRPFGQCEPCPADEVSLLSPCLARCVPRLSGLYGPLHLRAFRFASMSKEKSQTDPASGINLFVSHSETVVYYTANPRHTIQKPGSRREKSRRGRHAARWSRKNAKISGSSS